MENDEKITHNFYETKAQEFSNTRYKTWPKIKEFCSNIKGLTLDAGCGNGRNMIDNYIGVDFSYNLLQQARNKHSKNACIEANILKIPFKDCIFNNILSIAVIHHLNSPERRLAALLEMYRLLKTGGCLLIYVWNRDAIKTNKFNHISNNDYMVDWKNTECMRYYHMYNLDEFEEFVLQTKFTILEIGIEQESIFARLRK